MFVSEGPATPQAGRKAWLAAERTCFSSPYSSNVSGLFPLVSNFFHDDDNLSAVESLSRRRGMDMQMYFVIGYAFFLSDFIANEGIGPSDGFAPDFVVGFPLHFIPDPFDLLWGTASQELFEVSDAPRPKHRLDRGLRCGVAGKGER